MANAFSWEICLDVASTSFLVHESSLVQVVTWCRSCQAIMWSSVDPIDF